MNVPSNVSDRASDSLVELFFLALGGMEPTEMVSLLGAVLHIMSLEIRRSVEEERERWTAMTKN